MLDCWIAGQVWWQSETWSIKKSNNIGGSGALHHAWHCTVRTGHHHHQGTWMWFAAHWSSLHHHWSHLMLVRGLEGLRRGRRGRRVVVVVVVVGVVERVMQSVGTGWPPLVGHCTGNGNHLALIDLKIERNKSDFSLLLAFSSHNRPGLAWLEWFLKDRILEIFFKT